MNTLPINKLILASFAFAMTHVKSIAKLSLVPLALATPFLSTMPQILEMMEKLYAGEDITTMVLPENIHLYLALFVYGYSVLSIGIYRLVVQGGNQNLGWMPLIGIKQFLRFLGLSIVVGAATTLPVLITGMPLIQLIVYFLIIPITLNFVNIALDQPSQYRWSFSFLTQFNLFFLQAVLPALVGLVFAALFDVLGLPNALEWIVRVLVFYWTLINLALCYQLLVQKS